MAHAVLDSVTVVVDGVELFGDPRLTEEQVVAINASVSRQMARLGRVIKDVVTTESPDAVLGPALSLLKGVRCVCSRRRASPAPDARRHASATGRGQPQFQPDYRVALENASADPYVAPALPGEVFTRRA